MENASDYVSVINSYCPLQCGNIVSCMTCYGRIKLGNDI